MFNALKTFKNDETGAISVDWVVLTASMVLLASAVAVSVRDSTIDASDVMAEKISETPFN